MKKGEQTRNKSCSYSCDSDVLNYKTVLTTILCTLVGLLIVISLFYAGYCMANANNGGSGSNNGDIAILPVTTSMTQFEYRLGEHQKDADTDESYLLSEFDFKYDGNNYAIINTKDQLDSVIARAVQLGSNEYTLGVDSDFFQTGSVLAVTVEEKDIENIFVENITRDEKYNITVSLTATPIEYDEDYERTDTDIYCRLFLIAIDNIQPTNLTVERDF